MKTLTKTSVTWSARAALLELLLQHLSACVGSPLSVNRLSHLLQVAHETVEHWLAIFERLYVCHRIAPFGAKRIRAVRKEKKLYFWDCHEETAGRRPRYPRYGAVVPSLKRKRRESASPAVAASQICPDC